MTGRWRGGRLAGWRAALASLFAFAAACGGGGGGGGGSADEGPLFEDLNADGEALVIAFGDSITRGQGDGPTPTSVGGGYPARIPLLIEQDPEDPPLRISNQGVGGERVTEARTRLRRTLADNAADYVILLEGINDIGDGEGSRALEILERMVGDVLNAGVMPILGTLTPTCCQHAQREPLSEIARVNDGIRSIAQANGIVLVDFNAAFVVPPKTAFDPVDGLIHTPEGLHPTPEGYHRMTLALIDAVRAGPLPAPTPTN